MRTTRTLYATLGAGGAREPLEKALGAALVDLLGLPPVCMANRDKRRRVRVTLSATQLGNRRASWVRHIDVEVFSPAGSTPAQDAAAACGRAILELHRQLPGGRSCLEYLDQTERGYVITATTDHPGEPI